MAVLNVLIERSPEQVWQVLSDGWAYAEWVAGTRNIRDVDARWPEPGARIHYSFGVGPWTLDDVTTVRVMEPCRVPAPVTSGASHGTGCRSAQSTLNVE
jgi:uncharacterized protein YndB with AHSA1/START domain